MNSRDEYADRHETTDDERIPELVAVHGAADCAEYASREDFIEQVIPKLDTYSVPHLWVLSALLRDQGDTALGKLVAYYPPKVEAAVAQAIRGREIKRHPPRNRSKMRWYMPSPTLLWGEWRAQQAHREGWSKGWEDHGAAPAAVRTPAKKPIDLTTFLHDWTPKRRRRSRHMPDRSSGRVQGRSCGECTFCCVALAVEPLSKPCGTPCKHLHGRGCSIYRKRPGDCREFECLWLSGFGPEERRPDRVGCLELLTNLGDGKLGVLRIGPDGLAD